MNSGLVNEDNFVALIKQYVKQGYSSFVFKGDNGLTHRYDNIVNALKFDSRSRRSSDGFYKADAVLVDKRGDVYPVSIKMHDCMITWESADGSLKHVLYDFVDCYGSPIIPHSKKVIIPNDEVDLHDYVFGDDILNDDGIIIIQKFHESNFVRFNNKTIVVNCSRSFKSHEDVFEDELYKPCITIRKDKNRNLTDPKAKGYRIEVSPMGQSTHMDDILDEILFK